MPIRISIISYLNTVPFVYGLQNHPIAKELEFHYSTPSQAAKDVSEGKTDLGIIPSAVIPSIQGGEIVSDYCIGAQDNVASVLLCSSKPISEIDLVYLDQDSRTSVLLSRILFRKYWKRDPMYAKFDFAKEKLDYTKTYILIGDKALSFGSKFEYVYDLATEWNRFTGLPFVFACWASGRKLDAGFVNELNQALKMGVQNIELAAKTIKHEFDYQYAVNYLSTNISYDLNRDKRNGLSEFWSLALEELKSKVRWFG